MYQVLNGPAKQTTLTVNTTTVQELKVDVSPLSDRRIISIQPNGKIYLYFEDETVGIPSSSTVIAHGFTLFKDAFHSIEATASQKVYILAVSGTVNVKVAERS